VVGKDVVDPFSSYTERNGSRCNCIGAHRN
jgi:hypothetical protein